MREYYHLRDDPGDKFRYEAGRKYWGRFDKFKKKKHYNNGFEYYTLHGLGHQEYIRGFYLYLENGVFYEFFSGLEIGKKAIEHDREGYQCIILDGDVFGRICMHNDNPDNDIYRPASRMTESEFAYDVKKYMQSRHQIASIMREYCLLCHSAFLNIQKIKEQENAARNARENCNADWLNKYLNKR